MASLGLLGLGLPDGMLGVAWPSMSGSFGVPISSLGLLLATVTAGYVSVSMGSGRVLRAVSPGALLAAGAAVMGTGLLGLAFAPAWWTALACALAWGAGAGGIDAGLNTYAAIRFSARSTNWMHGFYGVGAATGPAIMTGILVVGGRWQWGFFSVAAALMALAAWFALSRPRWRLGRSGHASGSGNTSPESVTPERTSATLRLPAVWLGVAAFVLYTGLEMTAGQWTFTLLTEGRGVSTGPAGTWVSVYYVGLTGGRLGLGMLTGVIPAPRLLRLCMAAAVLGAGLFWLDITLWLSVAGIALLGLAFGPIFPSLIATTRPRIGEAHTPNAVGFQIAAASLGAAAGPGVVGVLASAAGLEMISLSLLAGAAGLLALYEALEWSGRRGAS